MLKRGTTVQAAYILRALLTGTGSSSLVGVFTISVKI